MNWQLFIISAALAFMAGVLFTLSRVVVKLSVLVRTMLNELTVLRGFFQLHYHERYKQWCEGQAEEPSTKQPS